MHQFLVHHLICRFATVSLCLAIALSSGCSRLPDDGIEFLDRVETQPISIDDFSELEFSDPAGQPVRLTDLADGDYLVLVITRGWSGQVCWYCASQTSKWARRVSELAPYNAKLVVIFPTESDAESSRVGELEDRIRRGDIPNETIPFPILLDINLLTVDQLGIRSELAKPATYILDKQGRVRFAYVGESMADRPSVDAVLEQLDRLAE